MVHLTYVLSTPPICVAYLVVMYLGTRVAGALLKSVVRHCTGDMQSVLKCICGFLPASGASDKG